MFSLFFLQQNFTNGHFNIPFFPALGTMHLPHSTTKTFHIIETSLVKTSFSSSPA